MSIAPQEANLPCGVVRQTAGAIQAHPPIAKLKSIAPELLETPTYAGITAAHVLAVNFLRKSHSDLSAYSANPAWPNDTLVQVAL